MSYVKLVKNTYSLVVCSYNPDQELLDNAFKSAEGLFDEVIIVDDGSNFMIPDATIRHSVNKGLYEAKNTGISNAKGNIICFLDDDDELIPEEVLKMKDFVENNDSDVWYFKLRTNNGGEFKMGFNELEILNSNQFSGVSWFKKELWHELGGFTYPIAEDWDFWARAIKKKKRFTYADIIFYKYNQRADSVSASWVGDKFTKIRDDIRNNYVS